MPAFRGSVLVVAAALLAAGCATKPTPSPPPCASLSERPTAEIVFGRVSEDGQGGVSESAFTRFLQEEVNSRFPDGLTVVDAQGRWTPPAGSEIHDPSKMVMIVLRGASDDRDKLEAIRTAYDRRYHQPAVLVTADAACISP